MLKDADPSLNQKITRNISARHSRLSMFLKAEKVPAVIFWAGRPFLPTLLKA